MKLFIFYVMLICFSFKLFAQEELSTINFEDITVNKLIEISSKILNKNIITTHEIEGKVNFVSHTPISNKDLLNILITVLKEKGFYLKEEGNLLKIYKIAQQNDTVNNESILEIITLENAEAQNIIPILQEIFDKKSYKKDEIKPLISLDNESNSIIVLALKKELNLISSLIKKLDQNRLQVYVEAKIIELSENKTKNLGLKYGLSAANATTSNIFTLGANFGGAVNALDSSASALFTIPTQTLNSAIALGATLNILKINQVIDIVSEPSILCLNNKESLIYVGETKSFQTGLSVTDGGNTNTTYQREDIGLTLKVKPRISTQNRVILDIETILEDTKELQFTQINPDTTKKEVKTTAVVSNGESVILGGLIKNKSDTVKTKIPFLGDIPLLGEAFKHTKEINDKVNLVVIVTPYIIPKSKDLTFIKEQLISLKLLEEKYTVTLEKALEDNKNKHINDSKKENFQSVENEKLSISEQHTKILSGSSFSD